MIDWARTCELRDEIGADDFGEVVDLFLEEVNTVMDRLRQMTNRDSLEQDLHFLKGSALSLGFASFSIVCQDGERLSSQGRADEVDLQQIFRCFDQSNAIFLSELSAHLAA